MNKKLTNNLHEITKKIVDEVRVKQTKTITEETRRFMKNAKNLRRKSIPNH